ncbi:hypothetical protein [Roseobacter phage RDJL6]|nr:hypothetical protein [Roseobacter phage RDJL6]
MDLNNQIGENTLWQFMRESNYIEGIPETNHDDLDAHRMLLREGPTVQSVSGFVMMIEPRARLRKVTGLDVQVGSHVAPRGGPQVEQGLRDILLHTLAGDPFQVHRRYLNLHPFTDGNGRSARAIWLYMMLRLGFPVARGFMHEWYYQSLAHYDRTEGATNGMARKA